MYAKKKHIAVLNPWFQLGGSEAVAVWTVEALKDDFDVTFVTTENIDWDMVNRFFGSRIQQDHINVVKILTAFIPDGKGFHAKMHLAQRYWKHHNEEYDLAIATRGEMDLGSRGIQYIYIPWWNETAARAIDQMPNGLFHRSNIFRRLYKTGFALLSGFSEERIKLNATLAVSQWTSKIIKELYGIESKVLYPPVRHIAETIPWDEREDGFVCISTITPDKHIEKVIEIVRQVRSQRKAAHLHLVGPSLDITYRNKIERLCTQHKDWVTWEKGIGREALDELIRTHKFGIHGKPYEHFGIAAAEMVSAGCLCFVPDSGGQVEIVGNEQLTYHDVEDAVSKIMNVVSDRRLQQELKNELLVRKNLFSTTLFIEGIRKEVDNFFTTSS